MANAKAVVARLALITGKSATLGTGVKGITLCAAMFVVKHVLADYAHGPSHSPGVRIIYYIVLYYVR